MLDKARILEINKDMLRLGAPVEWDGQGYNKVHYNRMYNLAYKGDLTDSEAYVALTVLKTYTKTQLVALADEIDETLAYYAKAVKTVNVVDYDKTKVGLSWAFDRVISNFIKSELDRKFFRWTKNGNEWVLNLKWDGTEVLCPVFENNGYDVTNILMIKNNLNKLFPETDEEVKEQKFDGLTVTRPKDSIDTIAITSEYNTTLVDAYHEIPYMYFDKRDKTWNCYIEYSADLYDELKKNGFTDDQIKALKPWADIVRCWKNNYQLKDISEYNLPFKPYDFQPQDAQQLLSKRWMLNGNEMGCGKTFEQIIVGNSIPMKKLVICPPTLRINWKKEIQMVDKDAEVNVIYSNKAFKAIDGWNVIGYTSLDKFQKELEAENFQVIMVDEAHYIQAVNNSGTPDSKRAFMVLRLAATAGWVYPITGTPKTNRNVNLYNILRLLRHPLTRGKWAFSNYGKKYCDGQQGRWGWDFSGNSNDEELNDLLKPFMVRHLKKDVLPNLKKQRIVTPLEVDLREYHYEISEYLKNRTNKNAEDLARLMRARKVLATQKVGESIDFAKDIVSQGKKVVIVTCFTDVVKAIEKAFAGNCVKLVGGMTDIQKNDAIEEFQKGSAQVMAMNVIAGGVGVTLTAAYNMVINDFDWTPGNLVQAEDRICRGGQTELCNVYYLYAEGADMDEVFVSTLTQKFDTINNVVDGGTGDSINYLDLLDSALEKSTGIRKVRRVVKVDDEPEAEVSIVTTDNSSYKNKAVAVKSTSSQTDFKGKSVDELWKILNDLGGTCKKYDNVNIQKMRLVMAIKKMTS